MKRKMRVKMDSFKHWIVKMTIVFELEKIGHNVDVEVEIPGRGMADVMDFTTRIQYEVDGHHTSTYRINKAKKYLRPGLKDVIVVPIHKLSTDINEIRKYVWDYIVPD